MNAVYHYVDCGLDYVFLQNGFEEVKTNYGKGVAIHDIEGLHELISFEIINNRDVLTGDEFRFLRRELEFSQKQLADLFKVTDQTIANWEKGKVPIPAAVDILIRNLAKENILGESGLSEIIEKINDLERRHAEFSEQLEEIQIDRKMNMQVKGKHWEKSEETA